MIKKLFLSFILLSISGISSQIFAQPDMSEEAVKARIIERVGDVDALKKSGKIGENNAGYVEARGALNEAEFKLIEAENRDRRALYAAIGQRLGLTVQVVGESRAAEIRKIAARGLWLQSRDGKWYQK